MPSHCPARSTSFFASALTLPFGERLLFAALLSVSLLLPASTAALASLLPGVDGFVICTGSGMVEVRLDEDGNPVALDESAERPCLASMALTVINAPTPFWLRLADDDRPRFAVVVHVGADQTRLAHILPKRGPPAVG